MIYEIEYMLPQRVRVEASDLKGANEAAQRIKGHRGLLTRVTQVDPPLPDEPEPTTPFRGPPPGKPPTSPPSGVPDVMLPELVDVREAA